MPDEASVRRDLARMETPVDYLLHRQLPEHLQGVCDEVQKEINDAEMQWMVSEVEAGRPIFLSSNHGREERRRAEFDEEASWVFGLHPQMVLRLEIFEIQGKVRMSDFSKKIKNFFVVN